MATMSFWIRELFGRSGSRTAMRGARIPCSVTRPAFWIEQLEDRLTPANITWEGDVSSDWSNGDNWVGGVAPDANDVAVLDAAVSSVDPNLTQNVSVGGIQFTSPATGFLLGGNFTLTLGGSGVTVVDGGHALFVSGLDLGGADETFNIADGMSIESVISNGSITKSGIGSLFLNGSNTYAGTTTINAGALGVSASANLGDGSATNDIVLDGGTLVVSGNFTTSREILLSSGGSVWVSASNTLTLTGVISGAGNLEKALTGTVVFSAANTYSGSTTVAQGTLNLSAGGSINSSTSVSVATGATLTTAGAGVIGDTASVTVNGSLTLGGAETIGSLAGTNASATLANGGFLLTTGGNNTSTSFAGVISGTGGLTKQGSGTFTLNNANTYTGTTTVSAGTLALGASGAINSSTTLLVTATGTMTTGAAESIGNAAVVTVNGSLTLGGAETIGSLSGTNMGATLNNGGFLLTTGGNNTSTLFNGVISGAGGLTKQGSGTFTFGNANTYSGTTTVAAGTLALNATGSINSSTVVQVNASATLSTAGAAKLADAAAVTVNGSLTIGGAETIGSLAGTVMAATFNNSGFLLIVGGDNTSTSFAGTISGAGGLTKQGSGTLTLSNVNTYSGLTTINAGAISVAASNNLGDDSATNDLVFDGGTLITTGSFTLSREVFLNAGGGTFEVTGGTVTVSGVISGAGGLTKTGADQLTLAATNTYSGVTAINAGLVVVSASANLGNGSATNDLSFDGGTLLNTTAFTTTRDVTLNAGGGTFQTNADLVIFGVISGAGDLTKTGAQTLALFATNTYSGVTALNGGTVTVDRSTSLGDESATNELVFDGGVLNTISGFTTSRDVTLNAGGGEFEIDTGILTLSGVISGTGGLTKSGAQTLTLTGANTYLGATSIQVGSLILGAGGSINSSTAVQVSAGAGLTTTDAESIADAAAVTINGGLTLGGDETIGSLAGTNALASVATGGFILTAGGNDDTTSFAGVISGTGGLTKAGAGELTLTNVQTYSGKTTVAAGILVLDVMASINNSLVIEVVDPATLATMAANSLADTADVEIAGFLNLGGNETIGTLFVNEGSVDTQDFNLTLQGDLEMACGDISTGTGSLVLGGNVTLIAAPVPALIAGNLDLGGAVRTFDIFADVNSLDMIVTAVISNGGILKTGAGVLRFDGVNTYIGTTTVSAGELILDNGGSINTSVAVIVAAGATLTTNEAESLGNTASVTIGGTWTVGGAESIGALSVTGGSVTTGFALNVSSLSMTGGSIATGVGTLNLGGNVNTLASATSATISGNVNLGGVTRTFTVNNGSAASDLDISAVIGNGSIIKAGAGAMEFSGGSANTYTGLTTVNGGALNLSKVAIDAILGDLIINNTGTVNLLASDQISNSSDVTVNLGGKLQLGAFSDLIDALAVDRGTVNSTGGALTASGVTMSGGTIAMGAGSLVLNGNLNTLGMSAVATISGILDLGGATRTFDIEDGSASIDLNLTASVINGGITKTGGGSMSLAGTTANTYTGTTTVNAGLLNLSKTGSATSIAGALIVNSGGTVRITAADQIANASAVTVNAGGTLSMLGTVADTIGTLDVAGGSVSLASGSLAVASLAMTGGSVTTGSGFLILGGNVTINASATSATIAGKLNLGGATRTFNVANGGASADLLVSAVMSNGGFTKTGAGVMEITGNNSYTGLATISGGTLIGSGKLSGAVTVNSGATLATSGTIVGLLTVNSGGVFDPGGASASTVTLQGGATFAAGSTLIIDIFSIASYDLLYVTGGSGVNVTGANISVRLGYTPSAGHSFSVIVPSSPSFGVTGTFAQGSTVTSSGVVRNFGINYNAATSRMLTLTA